jgi:F-type H+-transporting ATPase subunit a
MPEQLLFTAFLNRLFAGPVDALLRFVHIPSCVPQQSQLVCFEPQAPITNAAAMQILVVAFLILVFLIARARFSVENPGPLQHVFEVLLGFIEGQSNEIIGHHSERFSPFLVSLFIYILMCNLLGLIPGFESPTAVPVVPLGCAIVAFFYYQVQGIKTQGALKYAKHFAGPMPAIAPLMIPIEIISHLARVLSLTIRLFANMFAGDMVTLVFFSLIPIGIPVVFLGLHIGVSILQAYIFVLLTTVYLQGAVVTEH